MLQAAKGTDLYLPLLLAVGTGMRRGELLGLRWCDVDLDGGTVDREPDAPGGLRRDPLQGAEDDASPAPHHAARPRRRRPARPARQARREDARRRAGVRALRPRAPGAWRRPMVAVELRPRCGGDSRRSRTSRSASMTCATRTRRSCCAAGVNVKVISRAPRARQHRHHARHVLARDARHAGGGRREDRRRTAEGTGGLMTDGIDRTDCPAFEELAVAWHEAGHAVGAVLVPPGLAIESVTIVPGAGYLGRYTLEDWSDNVIPDEDVEDSGEICEHERHVPARSRHRQRTRRRGGGDAAARTSGPPRHGRHRLRPRRTFTRTRRPSLRTTSSARPVSTTDRAALRLPEPSR